MSSTFNHNITGVCVCMQLPWIFCRNVCVCSNWAIPSLLASSRAAVSQNKQTEALDARHWFLDFSSFLFASPSFPSPLPPLFFPPLSKHNLAHTHKQTPARDDEYPTWMGWIQNNINEKVKLPSFISLSRVELRDLQIRYKSDRLPCCSEPERLRTLTLSPFVLSTSELL